MKDPWPGLEENICTFAQELRLIWTLQGTVWIISWCPAEREDCGELRVTLNPSGLQTAGWELSCGTRSTSPSPVLPPFARVFQYS